MKGQGWMKGTKKMKRYQLIVIGGGRLGSVIAGQAATWGAHVALLDPGGVGEEDFFAYEGMVDVYKGNVRFLTEHEVEVAGQVRLAAKAFIIALEHVREVPEPASVATTGEVAEEPGWRQPPTKKWVVLGGTAHGIEWAQTLARQGAQVTVVETGARLLPDYDPECLSMLETSLRQEGVRVRCHTQVVKVVQRANKKIIQLQYDGFVEALETDEIVSADYAVGPQVHGRPDCGVWQEEVRRVTMNALLGTKHRIDYSIAPRIVKTDPPLVAVGMSEEQARQEDEGARVWRGQRMTGLVKLITRRDGAIAGIHAVGPDVDGPVEALRQAKRNRVCVDRPERFQQLLQQDRTGWAHSLPVWWGDWVDKGIRAYVRLRR
jgi:pyruvate/2-oxoglutarate dehydrogenase complex dihydrolipoamide dehydrogenase (E3) component